MKNLKDRIDNELQNGILKFWLNNSIDNENGGFYGAVTNDNKIIADEEKGLIQNTRNLWSFARIYNYYKTTDFTKLYEIYNLMIRAKEYLLENFSDKKNGGFAWMLDNEANVTNTRKQVYGQAFAIYALCEFYLATNEKESLDFAIETFELIELHALDKEHNGYFEAFSQEWEKIEDVRLSDKDMNEQKSNNTHLHILEAYTTLYEITGNEKVGKSLYNLINIMLYKIMNQNTLNFGLFFDEKWNKKCNIISYGHEIEAAWLIEKAIIALEKDSRYKGVFGEEKKLVLNIALNCLNEYLDGDLGTGGMYNEEDGSGNIDKDKIWWVQAEACVGFFMAYQHTKYEKYINAVKNIWQYIEDYVVDKENGEWFWFANDTEKEPNKICNWKSLYHNGRACVELMERIKAEESEMMFDERVAKVKAAHEKLVNKKNKKEEVGNGIFDRYEEAILTAKHIPLEWRFDFDPKTNPYFMERIGVNAILNTGAIEFEGKIVLVPRIEGNDRKSFFGVVESENGIDGFKFWDYPCVIPETNEPDTNTYDMRLTKHEDGWIYGLFCTERKAKDAAPGDESAADAQCGIVRTKDLKTWERLPDLKTKSAQQRNVVLHPEFVDGKYALYTRPQDSFIEAGSKGGIGWGLTDSMENAVVDEEKVIEPKIYHTIKEVKNGQGPAPIKTEKGWLHLAHGVRNTAAGLRYVLYMFMTDLADPTKVIKSPGGFFIAPEGAERVGDVSNVVFSNGWVAKENGDVFIYYASSDTRIHVATTTVDKLIDYVMNTPEDPLKSYDCVQQRIDLINKNKAL